MTDALAVGVSVLAAHTLRFGLGPAEGTVSLRTVGSVDYAFISFALIVAWLSALAVYNSRDPRVIGNGGDEYRQVVNASLRLFGLLAIAAYIFHVELARAYVAAALPVGTLLLLLGRWGWRQWLMRQRAAGRCSTRLLIVGSAEHSAHLVRALHRHPLAGYRVVAACVPGGVAGTRLAGTDVPVVGDLDDPLGRARAVDADTVAVTSSDAMGSDALRRLGWALEGSGVGLVVVPSLTDVAGPRIHTRPVAGLPLLHVEEPQYDGVSRAAKRVFDATAASLGLVVLAPVLLVIAALVKLTSPGPVLFRQQRVGVHGEPFTMLKFRSMVVDAEERLATLLQHNESDGLLFKMKDDPRITRVGKVLRRFSLDELPQLVNVVRGDMSLVGPRPPLQREVEAYHDDVHRRLLVRPGITGLWQTSGRSDLSWEDSVRLDLYYVENRSMIGDLQILWRTARAVLGANGAY
ncbi:sugar transferase [Motilibacter sp. K478]|nr:sugar transferase [Motilibacter aurantiacus]